MDLVLALIGTAACKSAYEVVLEGNDVDLKYATAFDNFNIGKFIGPKTNPCP